MSKLLVPPPSGLSRKRGSVASVSSLTHAQNSPRASSYYSSDSESDDEPLASADENTEAKERARENWGRCRVVVHRLIEQLRSSRKQREDDLARVPAVHSFQSRVTDLTNAIAQFDSLDTNFNALPCQEQHAMPESLLTALSRATSTAHDEEQMIAWMRSNAQPPMSTLNRLTLHRFLRCAEVLYVQRGDYVFRKGDAATHFYMLVRGSALLIVHTASKASLFGGHLGVGCGVGEIALILDTTQAQSCLCFEDCWILALSREHYMPLLRDVHMSLVIERLQFLSQVPYFNTLPRRLLVRVAYLLFGCHFPAKEVIVKQGEASDFLYFVVQGSASITHTFQELVTNSKKKGISAGFFDASRFQIVYKELTVSTSGPREFFGEQSMLREGRREQCTTVRAGYKGMSVLCLRWELFVEACKEQGCDAQLRQLLAKVDWRRNRIIGLKDPDNAAALATNIDEEHILEMARPICNMDAVFGPPPTIPLEYFIKKEAEFKHKDSRSRAGTAADVSLSMTQQKRAKVDVLIAKEGFSDSKIAAAERSYFNAYQVPVLTQKKCYDLTTKIPVEEALSESNQPVTGTSMMGRYRALADAAYLQDELGWPYDHEEFAFEHWNETPRVTETSLKAFLSGKKKLLPPSDRITYDGPDGQEVYVDGPTAQATTSRPSSAQARALGSIVVEVSKGGVPVVPLRTHGGDDEGHEGEPGGQSRSLNHPPSNLEEVGDFHFATFPDPSNIDDRDTGNFGTFPTFPGESSAPFASPVSRPDSPLSRPPSSGGGREKGGRPPSGSGRPPSFIERRPRSGDRLASDGDCLITSLPERPSSTAPPADNNSVDDVDDDERGRGGSRRSGGGGDGRSSVMMADRPSTSHGSASTPAFDQSLLARPGTSQGHSDGDYPLPSSLLPQQAASKSHGSRPGFLYSGDAPGTEADRPVTSPGLSHRQIGVDGDGLHGAEALRPHSSQGTYGDHVGHFQHSARPHTSQGTFPDSACDDGGSDAGGGGRSGSVLWPELEGVDSDSSGGGGGGVVGLSGEERASSTRVPHRRLSYEGPPLESISESATRSVGAHVSASASASAGAAASGGAGFAHTHDSAASSSRSLGSADVSGRSTHGSTTHVDSCGSIEVVGGGRRREPEKRPPASTHVRVPGGSPPVMRYGLLHSLKLQGRSSIAGRSPLGTRRFSGEASRGAKWGEAAVDLFDVSPPRNTPPRLFSADGLVRRDRPSFTKTPLPSKPKEYESDYHHEHQHQSQHFTKRAPEVDAVFAEHLPRSRLRTFVHPDSGQPTAKFCKPKGRAPFEISGRSAPAWQRQVPAYQWEVDVDEGETFPSAVPGTSNFGFSQKVSVDQNTIPQSLSLLLRSKTQNEKMEFEAQSFGLGFTSISYQKDRPVNYATVQPAFTDNTPKRPSRASVFLETNTGKHKRTIRGKRVF